MGNDDNYKNVNFHFGVFELQPMERRLLKNGIVIELGPRAFSLLLLFVENADRLLTKEQIFHQLWKNVVVEENNLHVQISLLRKILGAEMIATVSGQGYRFTAEVVKREVAVAPVSSANENKAFSELNILIIDDHALIRDALSGVISEIVSKSQLFEAATIKQAQELLEQHSNIHYITLDLHLPDFIAPDELSGISYLMELRSRYPAIGVIIVSAENDRSYVSSTLHEGAQGYIHKSMPRADMVQAFKLIFSGDTYIPAETI
ncbi:MAG: response regulator [Pseudomonadota bacterium]